MWKSLPFITVNRLLAGVLVVAAILGSYRLEVIPSGMHSDEVINGYEAHCLALTGKDCHNRPHPVFIQAAEDYREGFLVYYLSLIDRFRPCDETTLRLGIVLLFLFSGYALFRLGRVLFDEGTGLCAAAVFFCTPWVFVLSRQIIRPLSSLPFLLLGLAASWEFLEKKRLRHGLLAGLFLGVALHTYLIARLFAPLVLLAFAAGLAIARDRSWRKYLLSAMPVFLVLASPIIFSLFVDSGPALTRMSQVSIFTEKIAGEFAKSHGGQVNGWIWPRMFFSRYLANLSPDFLFNSGDPNLRHSLKGFAQLYWAQIPLILAGLAALFATKRKALWLLFGLWFLCYPLPAAFSVGSSGAGLFVGGHAYRSLAGAPLAALLTGLGLAQTLQMIVTGAPAFHRAFREIAGTALVLVLLWYGYSGHVWFHHYFQEYPRYSWPLFGRTTHKALPAAALLAGPRKYVLVKDFPLGFPDYYAAFYSKQDPKIFQERLETRHAHNLDTPIGVFADYSRFQKTKDPYAILSATKLPGPPFMVFKGDSGRADLYLYDRLSSVRAIKSWKLCGPFDLPPGGTKEEIAQKAYPREIVDRCDEEGLWKTVMSREDRIDLWRHFPGRENAFVLAKASLRSRGSGRLTLFVGSDDGSQIWLDRRHVYTSPEPNRGFILDQDTVNLRLDDKKHEILLKATNGVSAWIFSVRAMD